jgi:hypothetical protein
LVKLLRGKRGLRLGEAGAAELVDHGNQRAPIDEVGGSQDGINSRRPDERKPEDAIGNLVRQGWFSCEVVGGHARLTAAR